MSDEAALVAEYQRALRAYYAAKTEYEAACDKLAAYGEAHRLRAFRAEDGAIVELKVRVQYPYYDRRFKKVENDKT
jgi:hypothetical protein